MIEMLGYISSVLVALSLMMGNVWRLRWINLFGAMLLAIYGLLVRAYPVFAVNGFIVCVDIYYILQMSRGEEFFHLRELTPADSVLNHFLDVYERDIRRFFPKFKRDELAGGTCFFILRNLSPVGFLAYSMEGEGVARVIIDYVVPEYRDLKNACFFFQDKGALFRSRGIAAFVACADVPAHAKYLMSIGFAAMPDRPGCYLRRIDGGAVA